MAGYPVQRGRPPVIMRAAARRRARDSGTLSGTSVDEERWRSGIRVKPAAIHGQSADLAASSRYSQTDCVYDHPPPFALLTRSSR